MKEPNPAITVRIIEIYPESLLCELMPQGNPLPLNRLQRDRRLLTLRKGDLIGWLKTNWNTRTANVRISLSRAQELGIKPDDYWRPTSQRSDQPVTA